MNTYFYSGPGRTFKCLFAFVFALVSAPFASADTLTFNISSLPGSNVVVSNGASHQAKVEGVVAPGSTFSVNVTVIAEAQGTPTLYPAVVGFVATGTNTNISPAAFANKFAARGASMTRTFTVTAPSTAGTYHAKFEALTGGFVGSNFGQIGFTVGEPLTAQPVQTTLALSTSSCCLIYHQSEPLTLTASLTRSSDGSPVNGKVITFLSAGNAVGSANTDVNGTASIPLNASSWAVGSYSFTAKFAGDSLYLGSSTAGETVAVRYKSVIFGSPISDGATINGNAAPVKIVVTDANDRRVADAVPYIFINSLSTPGSSVGSANVANVMRYDPTAQQYIFNWDTKAFPAGLLTIMVDLGEGACLEFGFSAWRSVTVSKKK